MAQLLTEIMQWRQWNISKINSGNLIIFLVVKDVIF